MNIPKPVKHAWNFLDTILNIVSAVSMPVTFATLLVHIRDPWWRYYQWVHTIAWVALIPSILFLVYQLRRLRKRHGPNINLWTTTFSLVTCIFSFLVLGSLYIPKYQIWRDARQGIDTIEIVVTDMEETGDESIFQARFGSAMQRAVEKLHQVDPSVNLIYTLKARHETNPENELSTDVLERMRRNKGLFAVIWIQYWRDEQGNKIRTIIPLQSSAIAGWREDGITLENLRDWKIATPPTDKDLAEWIADLALLYPAIIRCGQGRYRPSLQTFEALGPPSVAGESPVLENMLGVEPSYFYCLLNAAYETGQTDLLQKEIVIRTSEGKTIKGTLEELGIDQLEHLREAGALPPKASCFLDLLLGKACVHQGRWEQAQRYLDHTMPCPDKNLEAEAMYWIGVMQALQGKTEAAKEKFEIAIDLDPTLLSARLELGRLYFKKEDYDNAQENFAKILQTPQCTSKDLCTKVCADACYWQEATYRLLGKDREWGRIASKMCCRQYYGVKRREDQVEIISPASLVHVLDKNSDTKLDLQVHIPIVKDREIYIVKLWDGEQKIDQAKLSPTGHGRFTATLDLREAIKRCKFVYWPETAKLEAMKGFDITFYRSLKEYDRPIKSRPLTLSASKFVTLALDIDLAHSAFAQEGSTQCNHPLTITSQIMLDYEDKYFRWSYPLMDTDIADKVTAKVQCNQSGETVPDRIPLTPTLDPLSGEILFRGNYTPTEENIYECYAILQDNDSTRIVKQSSRFRFAAKQPPPTPALAPTPLPTSTPTIIPTSPISTPTATPTLSPTPLLFQSTITATPIPTASPAPCFIRAIQADTNVCPDSTSLTIQGSARMNKDFQRYEIKYLPPGYDPLDSNYNDFGITLENGGTQPVYQGTLACWDARETRRRFGKGWYILRLRVIDNTGNYLECSSRVRADGE